jgi:hypothetical protein
MIRTGVFVVKRGRRRKARRIFWGVALITVGVVMLLDRFGLIDIGRYGAIWWTWWPMLFIVGGLAALVAPDSARGAAKGFSTTLLGLWALACAQHWYGMSWARSWPLALVIVGIEAILLAVVDRRSGPDVEVNVEEVRHV